MSKTASIAKPRSGLFSKSYALKGYVTASCLLSAGLVLMIFGLMAVQSLPALTEAGGTLLTSGWNPADNQYGILPMLYGTLAVMLIAMAVAVPIGIFAAIYIAETRSAKLRRITRSALEILAGIPSIVYGLIGIAYVSVWVANGLDLQTGRLILTAGLIRPRAWGNDGGDARHWLHRPPAETDI